MAATVISQSVMTTTVRVQPAASHEPLLTVLAPHTCAPCLAQVWFKPLSQAVLAFASSQHRHAISQTHLQQVL